MIELSFDEIVQVTDVFIEETDNPGHIVQISALEYTPSSAADDANNNGLDWRILYQGKELPSPQHKYGRVHAYHIPLRSKSAAVADAVAPEQDDKKQNTFTPLITNIIRLHIKTMTVARVELDAVKLIGVKVEDSQLLAQVKSKLASYSPVYEQLCSRCHKMFDMNKNTELVHVYHPGK